MVLQNVQIILKHILIVFSIIYSSFNIYCNKERVANVQINEKVEEIPATEDLMREHGVLNRILLIYEAIIKREESANEFPLEELTKAIALIRDFIENYHEHLEETYIFPIFEKKKQEVALVKTLRKQHDQGRVITANIQKLANPQAIKIIKNKKEIAILLKKFITMYRPHEAREDTVLFPKVRSLITEQEFKELGEKFEDKEREQFGADGFTAIVKKVEDIEKSLGIYQLEQFTPSITNDSIIK